MMRNRTGKEARRPVDPWALGAGIESLEPRRLLTTTFYLADLTPTYQTNGWGSYEKNSSNGELATGDGQTITLNGKTHARGLGVHAGSVLRYDLRGGSYLIFQAKVGVDDEVGNLGSVVFQVWLDGSKAYDSGVMTGATDTRQIDLYVTGKSTLELRVTDAGNGNGADHADWAGARLVSDSTTPAPPPAGTALYLSDLTPAAAANGWGAYEKDRSNGDSGSADGRTITLNGVTYAKGLGVHSESVLTYSLVGRNGAGTRFQSDIGIDDGVKNHGSAVFQVWLDGAKVYDSGTMTGATATKAIDLDVSGKSILELRATDAGDGITCDHADWAAARLTSTPVVLADTTAPTTPGTPVLVSKTDRATTIQWAASTDNVGVTSYLIFRNGVQVSASTTTGYVDSGLSPSTTYAYTVIATDASGNVSALSGQLAVTTQAATPAAAKKIMPVGDSITQSHASTPSYRWYLWQSLQAGGYPVDFVGSWIGTPNLYSNFDRDHDGHSAINSAQVAASITTWATGAQPDIVLLHIGTNDVMQGMSASQSIAAIGQIIDRLRAINPRVTVLVAQIIPLYGYITQVQNLNALIPGLVSAKNTAQSRIITVDQYTGFDAVRDTRDYVHPNAAGEQKMSARWYAALQTVL